MQRFESTLFGPLVRVFVTFRVHRVLARRLCSVSLDLMHTDGVTLLELGQQVGNGGPYIPMPACGPLPQQQGIGRGVDQFVISVDIDARRQQITLLHGYECSVEGPSFSPGDSLGTA